jgi:hypothetical protein
LRLWSIGSRPGFDWDEPVYAYVASHGLYAKPSFGVASAPYLFHPPFYFGALHAWFVAFGEGIAQARVLAAIASVVTLAGLHVLVRRRLDATASLCVIAVLATDGWLVFTNRVGWIENTMMVLVVGGLLLYDRRRFLTAGLLLGFAVAYKHVAAYALLAVGIHWWLTREDRDGHRTLFRAAGVVIGVYVIGAAAIAGAFVSDTGVQLQRLIGAKASRGSIGGGGALEAIIGPYKVFAPTLALSAAAVGLLAARAVQRRPGDALLFSWAAASVIAFAALKLKMAHYFMMVEIPLVLYAASELARRRPAVLPAAAAILVAANLLVFDLRFVRRDDNALAAVRDYAAKRLPADALVMTEESVGSIIRQPYCKLVKASLCAPRADYLITYTRRTQSPPESRTLDALLRYAEPVAGFHGFKETITVLKAPRLGPVCARDRRRFCAVPGPGLPGRAAIRFGRYTALVRHGDARAGHRLPVARSPAVIFRGVDGQGRARFANVGRARCVPARRDCADLALRPGDSVHLEVPTVTGDTIPYELKVDGIAR